ncbi:virulence factor TspB C-terminal domain-related protein [Acidithiobacillus ferriphilus]|uniref:virulence factor TspB C-terminal domain-related protein n=1 Tax=Acidithiobacillus ferriphilus TaxID=1689834 RepID=UPI002DB8D4C7|nr:virulence factor TspB C-terminal domain-related protein [Acidithiobacillus ferriphilus]MEB8535493.1 virulence factor TspB C-terminal domain-related protein [Acidithiobacillus ferriphilus]
METLTCFGSFCLSLLLCALVSLWRDLTKNKASREGRGRSRRALLLLPPLLFFSSFSFGSSIVCKGSTYSFYANSYTIAGGPTCSSGPYYMDSYGYIFTVTGGSLYYVPSGSCTPNSTPWCSASCIPSSGQPVGEIGSSLTPNSNGVLPGTFCNPSTNCDTESYGSSAGSGGSMTNGQACFPTSPTSSTSSSSSSCPSGYSVSDASGCVCSNGSGSYVSSNNSSTNPSCNGGSSTAPTLSPVSPVSSSGTTSCLSGSATVTSGSSTSCYDVDYPPAVNNSSTPSSSAGGGSGGNSSFHLAAPTVSSNGQLTCPPGASTIGSGSSLECVVSGPGGPGSSTSPTASGSSGTSPTGSTASAQYPTSFSMPTMPTASVNVMALSQIASARESTSVSCPSPVTFNVMNHTFSITFTYACQLAAKVRPVVIGVFSMASLLLIVK